VCTRAAYFLSTFLPESVDASPWSSKSLMAVGGREARVSDGDSEAHGGGQQRTIESRQTENLHLADVDVLERVDALGGLLDLLANRVGGAVVTTSVRRRRWIRAREREHTYNLATRSLRSHCDSRVMILNIFLRICRIWAVWA